MGWDPERIRMESQWVSDQADLTCVHTHLHRFAEGMRMAVQLRCVVYAAVLLQYRREYLSCLTVCSRCVVFELCAVRFI